MAHCLCFLYQLVPREPLPCHLSGCGGCPPPPVLTVTCQARCLLENKELSLLGLCPPPPSEALRLTPRPSQGEQSPSWHRPILAWAVQDPPLTVPSVPRTELDPTCLPYWTRTWRARAGPARGLCAGSRAEAAGRLSTSWRRNSCLKCLMLFKHFSSFKGEQIKTLCLPLNCLMLLCLPKLWPRSHNGGGRVTSQQWMRAVSCTRIAFSAGFCLGAGTHSDVKQDVWGSRAVLGGHRGTTRPSLPPSVLFLPPTSCNRKPRRMM